MADYKNQGRSYVLTSVSSGIAIIATLASGVLLARLLSVEDRGLVALAIYWASFIVAIGNLSLHEAFVKRSSTIDAPLRERLPSSVLMSLLMAGVAIVIAAGVVHIFPEQFEGLDIGIVLGFFFAFLLISNVNRMLIAVEQTSLKFRRLALENVLVPVLYSGLLIVAGLSGHMAVITVLVIFLMSRAPILLTRIWRLRKYFLGPVRLSEMRALSSVATRFHGTALIRSVSQQADKLVVASQWSAAAIANFAVAYSAAGAAYGLVGQALGLIALPVASKVPDAEMPEHFAKSIRITTIMLCCVMIPIVLLAPLLVPLVFGQAYEGAVIYTQILAISILPAPLMRLLDVMLRARDQIGVAMQLHAITLALFGMGWLLTGYSNIVEMGLGLAFSRVTAFLFTITRLKNELESVKISDCIVWQRKDFALIFQTLLGLLPKRLRKR